MANSVEAMFTTLSKCLFFFFKFRDVIQRGCSKVKICQKCHQNRTYGSNCQMRHNGGRGNFSSHNKRRPLFQKKGSPLKLCKFTGTTNYCCEGPHFVPFPPIQKCRKNTHEFLCHYFSSSPLFQRPRQETQKRHFKDCHLTLVRNARSQL